MTCAVDLNPGSDSAVELRNLRDEVSGTPITDATAAFTLRDRDGVEVPGQTWPTTMDHVGNATYRGIASADLALTSGARYELEITALATTGERRTWYTTAWATT